MRSFLSRFAGDGTLTHFVSFGTNWAKWANWPRVTFQTLENRSAQCIISFCFKTMQHVKGLYSFLPLHIRKLQRNDVLPWLQQPLQKNNCWRSLNQLVYQRSPFLFHVTLPRSDPPRRVVIASHLKKQDDLEVELNRASPGQSQALSVVKCERGKDSWDKDW